MKHRHILFVLLAVLTVLPTAAQRRGRHPAKPDTTLVVKSYLDSLTTLRRQLDSLQQLNAELRRDADNGRYLRLFAPTTFYHSGARKAFSLQPSTGDDLSDAIDQALLSLYMRRPDLVRDNETALLASGGLRDDVNQEMTQHVELTNIVNADSEEPLLPPEPELVIVKPNFWRFKGDGFLQFLQNFVSGNWHKGGESNYSAVGQVMLELDYNDKNKITFENKLEMKLGFMTSRTDSVHTFKASSDLLRLTSKLGLQAHKRWYYTLQVTAATQFARGLKANDAKTYSDFMSPFDLNVGLGMEYKVNAFNGQLKGTLNFSPLSYNLRYVDRIDLSTRFGLDEGRHTLHDFGSRMVLDLEWKLLEQLTWKSRLDAFTSYKRALVEWENTFKLQVSKYISANLYLYPRFDDSGSRDDELGYFQFMEYSSLGLSYSF